MGQRDDSLVTRDPDTLKWLPSLATAWKVSDDSLTIDFTIRQGVTFSDGSPLTADDVVYTFELARNPDLEDPGMKVGIEKLDPRREGERLRRPLRVQGAVLPKL